MVETFNEWRENLATTMYNKWIFSGMNSEKILQLLCIIMNGDPCHKIF